MVNRDPAKRRASQVRAQAKYRYRNPDYQREWYLRKSYGLSIADYDRMVAEQDGRCAICGRLAKLVVDHDHDGGQVRSLLCDDCNVMLGRGKDSPEVFEAAASYLRRHSA